MGQGSRGSAQAAAAADTARRLGWQFALFYCQATAVAVATTMVLALIGLEFYAHQWWSILAMVPAATLSFVLPDIALIAHHYRPLRQVLELLDRGEVPTTEQARAALVRALNLPFYAFARVTFLHGPLAAFSGWWSMELANRWMHTDFQSWQLWIFPSLILLFASPSHAIVEFFRLSGRLAPVIRRLWPYCGGSYAGAAEQPIAVRLQSKLLYLCFFITALPLGFVAFSILFKINLLLDSLGVHATKELMRPIWSWIYSVLTVCLVGAVAMSVLTAREVSAAAARLLGGMNDVERGNLGGDLEITATDEYADLYRGFNLMVAGLRDEVKLLEVSQDLAGELQLDVLIRRILGAATELLDAERSTLFVHDPEKKELWSRLADGLTMREIRIPESAGVAGAVFTSGKGENIADAYLDPRFSQDIDRRTGYRTRSILCLPIVNKAGKRIGVTQVLNKKGGGSFSLKDEQRLRAFTAQIAVTLDNARLFDEVIAIKNYNENILACSTDGVVTLDRQRRVVTANRAALGILASTREGLIGSGLEELLARNPWLLRSIERVEESGGSDTVVDAELLISAGGKASVNLNTTLLRDAQGEHIGLMLSLEDFTSEKRVKTTMARYMSQEVADQLLSAGESVLGGQLQKVSILFSDVRSFTTISERLGPRETVSMLNQYFEQMVEVVFRHRGILDKYIGDAIMALFGAPFQGSDDADRAVATANEMLRALKPLNRLRAAAGEPPIEIGIGIATDEVVVGNIGSTRRMEYTVIGDGVNLASRLEGATKQYGVRVLLSDGTVQALKEPTPLREIDRIRVKGQDRPVTVYEALAHHDEASFPDLAACCRDWQAGLEAYRARAWTQAIAAFESVLARHPQDQPSRLYIERCGHYASQPPPEDWDCVYRLHEK
jgi:adenylate cyclase